MTRLELLTSALDKCKAYLQSEPGGWLWPSLIEQLSYLVDLESGQKTDRELLKNICVGAMAARNVEDRDFDLAKMLYKIQAEVQEM
jgi:hypothetical protein